MRARELAAQEQGASIPALPVLRRAAQDIDPHIDLLALVRDCARGKTDKQGRFAFEVPVRVPRGGGAGEKVVPLRLMRQLYDTIQAEIEGNKKDTRLRFERPAAGMAPDLYVRLPYAHAMAALREKRLLVLDATPSPLWRVIRPDAEVVRYHIPEALLATQEFNRLGVLQDLLRPDTRAMVQRIIESESARARERGEQIVVVFPKSLVPIKDPETGTYQVQSGGYEPVEGVEYVHWGGETRSLNAYEHCTTMISVGHYAPPLEAMRAFVEAMRWGSSRQVQAPASERRLFRRWGGGWWTDPAGNGLARIVPIDADPLVQAVWDHARTSEVEQADGRLRSILAPLERPKRLLLLRGDVSVPVNELVTLQTLAGQAAAAKRRSSVSATQRAALTAGNVRRQEDAAARARAAAERLIADGKPVTATALRREAGVRAEVAREVAIAIEGGYGGQVIVNTITHRPYPPSIEQIDVEERAEAPGGDHPPLGAPGAPTTGLAASVRR